MTSIFAREFPTAEQLWCGVVVATIANALFIAHTDSYEGGRIWLTSKGGLNVYLRNDDAGTFGFIGFRDPLTFDDPGLAGVFCSTRSDRYEPGRADPDNWRPRLVGMPADLRTMTEQDLLEFPLVEGDDPDHTLHPCVTAACWSEDGRLTAAEPWSRVVAHGAHVLTAELMKFNEEVEYLRDDYLLFDDQLEVLTALYRRKLADRRTAVRVQPAEYEVIVGDGDRGIAETRTLLAAIGILLP